MSWRRYARQGGYAAEHEIVQVLEGLGIGEVELERPVEALSGGQKTRLALARVLSPRPICCCWTSRRTTWTARRRAG